jgi:hypothetical protein
MEPALVGLLVSSVLTVAFIYILLFGQSDSHRNGLVGKLNRLLTTRLPLFIG